MSVDRIPLPVSSNSAPASCQSGCSSCHCHPSTALHVTNVTKCDTPAAPPAPQADPNPVPPHRRGIYTFRPTPKARREGMPILADQESWEQPFRPDSQLAAVPVRIPTLSDQQLTAIQLLVDGHAESWIAKKLQMSRMTLWRWKTYHPLFKSELSRRRHEAWSAAGDRFRRHLFAALKHIRQQINDVNALTSFRAARLLLTLAGSNRFAPPDEPTDPQAYLDNFALARRKEIHSPDLLSDPATMSERDSALATLLAQCEDPNQPPPGMQPDPPQVHALGSDDDPGSDYAQGSD